MKKRSVFLLSALLLTTLALPVSAASSTAPTLPKFDVPSPTTDAPALPANLGSIIGLVLAGLLVVAVVVIVILKKRK